MKFYILLVIFVSLSFVENGSNGSMLGEVYWKSKFPNSTLPKALQELFQPANAGNLSGFAAMKVRNFPSPGRRQTYGIGYWNVESKKFDKKNKIYNETTTYFLYNDLHPNKKMKLIFTKSMTKSNFLPRKIAESIPFSSNKSQQILNYFTIKPASKEAQIIKQTIEECEAPTIRGEVKYCATSFEALVDFVSANLGKNVRAISNEVEEENKKQVYTILNGIRMIKDDQIVCHKQIYKYAVFYCHRINATKAYMVPLLGYDSSKAKAVVVCHFDTSAWNPQHLAFQVLNVKPAGPPICHFLNSDTIVWIPV